MGEWLKWMVEEHPVWFFVLLCFALVAWERAMDAIGKRGK